MDYKRGIIIDALKNIYYNFPNSNSHFDFEEGEILISEAIKEIENCSELDNSYEIQLVEMVLSFMLKFKK